MSNWGIHRLTIVLFLRTVFTIPLDATFPRINHGLVQLTSPLNTTGLAIPICGNSFAGHEATLFDCAPAINAFRRLPHAYDSRIWTARDTVDFKAVWKSCEIRLAATSPNSEDTFPPTIIADIGSRIIRHCIHIETLTTTGGTDLVGPKQEFQVTVSFVEPN